ncbi:hypothetical protein NPIL_601191 [Nephila pilipes]|uniref:Uncharacterized protein n=1 Tax=Nephila pilipes TaxID=299642 RepID=A0A8X6T2I6_NEPPI|nr:hypothetical protein NPIL_601191 [Nephila pilipes]
MQWCRQADVLTGPEEKFFSIPTQLKPLSSASGPGSAANLVSFPTPTPRRVGQVRTLSWPGPMKQALSPSSTPGVINSNLSYMSLDLLE